MERKKRARISHVSECCRHETHSPYFSSFESFTRCSGESTSSENVTGVATLFVHASDSCCILWWIVFIDYFLKCHISLILLHLEQVMGLVVNLEVLISGKSSTPQRLKSPLLGTCLFKHVLIWIEKCLLV